MAQFPAIPPDRRSYGIGQVPTVEHRGPTGVAYFYRVGTLAVGQLLELPFTNRPGADAAAIWAHYEAQAGELFTLPAATWCGHEGGDPITDASLLWRYTAAPELTPDRSGFRSITVTLEAVGATIGPTASGGALPGGQGGTIIGSANPSLPPRPTPVPDPDILPPTIDETPSADGLFPPLRLRFKSTADLTWSSYGIPPPLRLRFKSSADLTYTPAP